MNDEQTVTPLFASASEALPPKAPLAMPKQRLEREGSRAWYLLFPRLWAKTGH